MGKNREDDLEATGLFEYVLEDDDDEDDDEDDEDDEDTVDNEDTVDDE